MAIRALLGNYLTFGDKYQALGIDLQGYWAIGKACRYAVAVTLKGDQTGWGDPLGVLDIAVKRLPYWHEVWPLFRPYLPERLHLMLGYTSPMNFEKSWWAAQQRKSA